MNRWMTLAEIASAALPGLPATARGMAKRAQADGWTKRPGLSRPRRACGGGLEFSVELLPTEAQAELVRRAGGGLDLPQPVLPGIDLREDDPLTGAERDRRDARLQVLSMFEEYRKVNGNMPVRDARLVFPRLWNGGEIPGPAWVKDRIPTLSKKVIDAWRRILRDLGPDALGSDRRGRPSIIETAAGGRIKSRLLGAMAKNEFLSAEHHHDDIEHWFSADLPGGRISTRTIQRARARLEVTHRNELLKARDPDAHRSRVLISATNSTSAVGLNDRWQIDASPADVMLKGAARHSVYLAVDIWSRRVKILVTASPRAVAVAALMRKCLLDWGVPTTVQTDQGSDFTAKATARLMTALQIDHDICDAFSPARKGNVERAIKTFQHDLPMCPGYIGHNVAERKVIENRKAFSRRLGMPEEELFGVDLDLVEFQAWCDTWAEKIYATRPHGGIKGQTPFLRATSWKGEVRKLSAPAALDVLLAPVAGKDGIRRVTKQGIKIGGEYYMTAAAWPGDDVFVRMDPMDLGRAMVFAVDGETWLGEALCPELAGLDPAEVTMRVKAAQKAHEKEALVDIRREMRAIGPRDFMNAAIAQAEKRSAAVVAFERPTVPYSTPALEAAEEAARAAKPEASPYTAEQRAAAQAAILPLPVPQAAPKTTPEQRFRRALGIEARIERGEVIDPDDEVFIRGYRLGAEYRGWMRVYERQGEAMFAR